MKNKAYFLFGAQLLCHVCLLISFFVLEWYHWVAAAVVYFCTGCIGMTCTYHRLLTHRSYTASKFWRTLGTIFGAYGLVGSPISWVSVHRAHHGFTDTDRDPHSPIRHPWWKVQWFSMFAPVRLLYGRDLLREPLMVLIHRRYEVLHIGIIYSFVMAAMLTQNPAWLTWFLCLYAVPNAILWNAGSSVNTLCHLVGYISHIRGDNSRNNPILGVLLFGEGWHNNHHASPGAHRFGERTFEVDVGAFMIERVMRE